MSAPAFTYPAARRDDGVVEDYHGTSVPDPYRWLEDPDSEETAKFVEEQNKITMPYLKECPAREPYKARLKEMFNYEKYGTPFRRGDRFFYYYNPGLANQSLLYTQASLDAEAELFLDPNTLSDDGTVSLKSVAFSEDGALMAYGLSASGSDWVTLHVRRVSDKTDLEDKLEWVKFSCISWTHDHKGFFYNRYDKPKEGKGDAGTETDSNVNQMLYYHRIGTKQEEDILVYKVPEHPKWMIGAEVTDDGKYIVLTLSEGCDPVNRLYYTECKEITPMMEFTKVVDNFDAEYSYIANEGSVFTFKTNLDAPRYRLIRADLAKEELKWDVLIEETKDVLEWVSWVNTTQLVVCYLQDVKSALQLHSLATGELIKKFPLDLGTVVSCTGRSFDTAIFYKFVSFLTPGTIYRCDLTNPDLESTTFRTIEVANFDPSAFETKQVFYTSKDGTKIPMFLIHKKGMALNGNNPTMLYGYGGFNISLSPGFSVSRLLFCQHFNGVYAIANLRGGGEYGETWHKAGSLATKQNVFDDFISGAEYLIAEKYTQASKLAINGGSNGGLLVGACLNQRPDLFGCAVANVGVMDMLRFHKFTIGHAWITDFGCSDDAEQFQWLIKYSPLHNVKAREDVPYPSTLLLTGDHDDRVVPLHTLKLIATLQSDIGSKPNQTNPLLVRVECKAGHGAGKPTEKVIEESADMYAFVGKSIGAEWAA